MALCVEPGLVAFYLIMHTSHTHKHTDPSPTAQCGSASLNLRHTDGGDTALFALFADKMAKECVACAKFVRPGGASLSVTLPTGLVVQVRFCLRAVVLVVVLMYVSGLSYAFFTTARRGLHSAVLCERTESQENLSTGW